VVGLWALAPSAVTAVPTRDLAPVVPAEHRSALVAGNTAFALALYRTLAAEPRNLFLSPASVSIALAMAYAGAAGDTATQIAAALRFPLPPGELHPAFNWLDLALRGRGGGARGADGQPFRLHMVNATWGQHDHRFLESYLDAVAVNYGAALRLLDFESAPEPSRVTINDWVSSRTERRIPELLPPGSITRDARLVLTNAIYFNAAWASQFNEKRTAAATFRPLRDGSVTVPFMRQTGEFPYADGDGYRAVELPYDGRELSMIVLVPDEGRFEEFERTLSVATLDGIIESMDARELNLALPRFELRGNYDLVAALGTLGIKDAFVDGAADFSGLDGTRTLSIAGIFHATFVSVREAGTEAAAASAVTMGLTAAKPPPIDVTIDRPFLFLIRDRETRALVFLGRVVNPS
jgi:serpin B